MTMPNWTEGTHEAVDSLVRLATNHYRLARCSAAACAIRSAVQVSSSGLVHWAISRRANALAPEEEEALRGYTRAHGPSDSRLDNRLDGRWAFYFDACGPFVHVTVYVAPGPDQHRVAAGVLKMKRAEALDLRAVVKEAASCAVVVTDRSMLDASEAGALSPGAVPEWRRWALKLVAPGVPMSDEQLLDELDALLRKGTDAERKLRAVEEALHDDIPF